MTQTFAYITVHFIRYMRQTTPIIFFCNFDNCSFNSKEFLIFLRNRIKELFGLFYYKTSQLSYFNELHRKRLLKHNDRKHIRMLSKAIDKDLSSIKSKLSESLYLQLQLDYVRYRNQLDIESLLKLQKKIISLL